MSNINQTRKITRKIKQKTAKLGNQTRKKLATAHAAVSNISNTAQATISNIPTATQAAERLQAATQALTAKRKISKAVLDRELKQNIKRIKKGTKALALISKNPEVQEELAETIEKVGNATAAVAANSGEILADFAEKMGPAIRTLTMAASDMVNDTIFNSAMGIVGAVPIVGDIVSTAGQEFKSTNENFWRSYWASMKAFPELVGIANRGVAGADESMDVIRSAQEQTGKLINAIDNVSKAIGDDEITANRGIKLPEVKKKALVPIVGGKRTRKRKHRRKKGTKKRALKKRH